LNNKNLNKVLVSYPLILLLYRDPGSVKIIFTDSDPDPKARDPHPWLQSFDESKKKLYLVDCVSAVNFPIRNQTL
jgi:hypothetical protein